VQVQVGAARGTSSVTAWGRRAPRSCATTRSPDIGPDTEGVGDLEADVEEGVPVAAALPGQGRIASGQLPGGPVVTTVYIGVPEGVGAAYARIAAWLQEHGEEPAARPGRSTTSLTSSDTSCTRACPTARRGATASCSRLSRTAPRG
jgi:hypothetical protein